MTLLFVDGFEAYSASADMALRWTLGEANSFSSPGRFGYGKYLSCGGSGTTPQKDFSAIATVCIGFGYRRTSNLIAGSICTLFDGTTAHITLMRTASGAIEVRRGTTSGTVLATSSQTLSIGVWYHIEFKATINDTTGVFILKVNGVEWINFSGDTRNGVNAQVTRLQLHNSANTGNNEYDDLYICDTSGSYNNDLLGDVRVYSLVPNGSGANSEFVPLSGNNYQNVDETVYDSDTTYNSGSDANQTDTYAFTDVGANNTIKAVVNNLVVKKDDAGVREVASVVRSGSTNYVGTTQSVPSSYGFLSQIYETDPSTSSPWTLSNLNSTEFGIRIIT